MYVYDTFWLFSHTTHSLTPTPAELSVLSLCCAFISLVLHPTDFNASVCTRQSQSPAFPPPPVLYNAQLGTPSFFLQFQLDQLAGEPPAVGFEAHAATPRDRHFTSCATSPTLWGFF